jgi:NAD(P)H-hydrate epimerase
VLAIGPGLGQNAWGRELLTKALYYNKPTLLDADALNILAEQPCHQDNWVLTPHPGEAARLLNTDNASIQQDRFSAITALQQRYGGVIVLKGAGSLITGSARFPNLSLCSAGNPGMGSGGMGDVLSGVIAGLLAQGLKPEFAARLGVFLHAHAADLAATAGERGLLACDLLPFLRQLVNPV